jgi:hypothetical protein
MVESLWASSPAVEGVRRLVWPDGLAAATRRSCTKERRGHD